MSVDPDLMERGVLNLLVGCAGAARGESLLILREDGGDGYYEADLAETIASVASRLGLSVSITDTPFLPEAEALPPALAAAVAASDHALFLARIGDQLRFQAMPSGSRPVVSYALDREALASGFGTAPYATFLALKRRFDAMFAGAGSIRVTCPLGTDFAGRPPRRNAGAPPDVTIKRFPMSVFAPIEADDFEGRVAVAHLLVGTGSRYYEPYGFDLSHRLFAHVSGGRLLGWEGDPDEVARAEAHYEHVAARYGLDGSIVHSWHAGIHPGCAYAGHARDHYARWSGSAFGNPRLLHFHTCGAFAPGEICWNVVDPTIEIDGVRVWDHGRINPEAVPGALAVLDSNPEVRQLFDNPSRRIGLGGDA
jgi:hypothetical protein